MASAIFSDSSSFIPLFTQEDITKGLIQKTFDISETHLYAIPIPFGRDGVYPSDTYSWNEFCGLEDNKGAMHLENLQLFFLLINQLECGTPALTLEAIKAVDTKVDYDKLCKNKKNFVNATTFGSTFFNLNVTKEYRRIHHNRGKREEEKEEERKSTADVIDHYRQHFTPSQPKNYGDMLGKLLEESQTKPTSNQEAAPFDSRVALLTNFGKASLVNRSKFDIALLPVYKNPKAATFKEKEICGAILLAFSYDPLWDMMNAWRIFVSDNDEHRRNPNRKMLHFNSELFMLNILTVKNSAEEFSNHFRQYIAIDPEKSQRVALSGGLNIDNPESRYDMRHLWSYGLAVKHMAAHAGKEKDVDWLHFYRDSIHQSDEHSSNSDKFNLSVEHHPYIIDYNKFIWNSANEPETSEEGRKNPKGVFHEFFPWVEEYLADEIKYFYRVEPDDDDSSSNPLKNNYSMIFDAVRSNHGHNSHTFVPGNYNAIVATAERIKKPRKKLIDAIQHIVSNNKEVVDYLFRDRYEGKELNTILAEGDAMDIDDVPNPFLSKGSAFNQMPPKQFGKDVSLQMVQHFNQVLKSFEERAELLRDFELRICHFMDKRVLTTRNKKPLTSAIEELVRWVDGQTPSAKVPQEGVSIINTEDYKPLRQRNISLYQMSNIHPELDTMAHAIMYYATCMRYIDSNANVHDLLILRHGLNDAYRYETNVHFNYAATGPAAASKSHGLKTDKKFRVPGMVTSLTNFSAQAFSSFGDHSDSITSLDEAPPGIIPKTAHRGTVDFSPEAAQWKAQLSQGFNVRQILDIGKGHFSERSARLIVCVLIGCLAFASNIPPSDKALLSRCYHAIARGLTDDTIDKTKSKEKTKEAEDELVLPSKLDIQDLIFHTPNERNIQAGAVFKDAMIIEHALVALINKGIQGGFLPEVSMDMSIVTAKMYKFLKIQMKKSPNLRVMQRPLLLARSMTITRAANILFNIPGIHDHLHEKSYELVLLHYAKPFLHCTLQTMLLAFGLLVNEVYQPIESIVVRAIVNNQLGLFPTSRFFDLVHHRNVERSKKDLDINQTLLSESDKATQESHPIRQDVLWPLFRDSEFLPLEALFKERYNQLFREISTRTKPKTSNNGGVSEAVEKAQNYSGSDDLVDLNYINLNISLHELVNTLYNRIKPTVEHDNIREVLNNLKARKLKIMSIPPTSKQVLYNLGDGEFVSREEREMNLLETTDNDKNCYLCIHVFDEILDKSDSGTMIREAFKSIYYQRLEPRTLLLGTEMSKNYDVEFTMLKITAEDLVDKPKYLTLIDPTQIQNKMNSMNNQLITSIAKNIDGLVEKSTELIQKKFGAPMSKSKLTMEKRLAKARMDREVNIALTKGLAETSRQESGEVEEMLNNVDPNENSTEASDTDATGLNPENANLPPKKPKKSKDASQYVTIKEDLDTWAIKKHFLAVGIPMKIDEKTGEVLCKIPSLYPKEEWGPLPTPKELMKRHLNAEGKPPSYSPPPGRSVPQEKEKPKGKEKEKPKEKEKEKKSRKRKADEETTVNAPEKPTKKARKDKKKKEKEAPPSFLPDMNSNTATIPEVVMVDANETNN